MNNRNEMKARRAAVKLGIAMDRLNRHYPFHTALLGRMKLVARPSITTMAVTVDGDTICLLYNPSFVLDECSHAQLEGVLHHEVNHVLFGHLTMKRADYPDTWALTVAQEITVNEYVPEPLPPTPVTLKDFPQLPPDELTEKRYRRLCRVPAKKRPEVVSLDDHSLWPEIADLDHARAAIGDAIEAAVVLVGVAQVPEEMHAAIKAAIGLSPGDDLHVLFGGSKPTIDWRQQFRWCVGQVLEVRPSCHRPPRRFPDLIGILPGQRHQAGRPKVLAVIDTSGSISEADLAQINVELQLLARHDQVTVVECDAAIQAVYPYRPIEAVHGRGGTDLRPPLEKDFLRRHRPDLIIYFTDGEGPAPDQRPAIPVIWCLTRDGKRPASWGRELRMA
jgi:predicted metal-dependent peptidase